MSTQKKKTPQDTSSKEAASQHLGGSSQHRPLSTLQYDCSQEESAQSLVFVLVHGAWHGGWCWQKVAALLRAQGHTVYTPTLTGLGERSHLISADITLDTFVDDVANLIRWEKLCNVVLVGHSFGGLVISGVADALAKQLRQLIYLDAFILPHGLSTFDTLPADTVQKMRQLASKHTVAAVPAPPAHALGLSAKDELDFIAGRLTPQPLSTYESALNLQNSHIGNHLPCTYISCTSPAFNAVEASKQWAAEQKNWDMQELACGHMAMISAPEALSKLLLELCSD